MNAAEEAVELHGTAIAIDGRGLLLRGRSGTGKSDLALRLIDGGAALISDDRVRVVRAGETLLLRPPVGLASGLEHRLEVRGLGIFKVAGLAEAPLALVADLLPGRNLDRLPGPQSCRYLGLDRPLVVLDPFVASAPAKLRLAARGLAEAIIPPP